MIRFRELWDKFALSDHDFKVKYCPNIWRHITMSDEERDEMWRRYRESEANPAGRDNEDSSR